MTTIRKHLRTRLLIAATAATAVLGAPAAAQAAVTTSITATGVSIAGDDLDNGITVTDVAGLLVHNLPTGAGTFNSTIDWDAAVAGDQTVAANAATTVVAVTGGAGADTLTVTAAILRAEIDGGLGNDLITGTANADVLTGGDGDDRVIGAKGNDSMKGGAGNDQLVWNNGDNNDTMDGEAGADEIEVNGAATAGDSFTIKPGAVAARVRFDRINLVPFNLDIGTSERMTVNGLGGDDVFDAGQPGLAALTLLTLSGGVGADAITGGDGADLLTGGDGVDTLTGGAGDDRVVGDRGNDVMAGGAGDDTLVWNNGDNNDTMDGQDDSDRVEVNGAVAAGDAFTLAPNGARAKFDRTNLVPFTLDIATTEALHVNALGGDDTFTPAAGTSALLRTLELDGGSGNDTLTGGDGADVITGASGNDTLTGGAGLDAVDGGPGNDSVLLRDGGPDIGTGGAGTDAAQADRAGLDSLAEFETVDQATGIRALQILSSNVNGRKGTVALRVACPAGIDGGCRGTIRITSASPLRFGKVRLLVTLGSAKVTLAPGQTAIVRIKLAPGARLLGRKYISVRATALVRDASGSAIESSRTVRVGF